MVLSFIKRIQPFVLIFFLAFSLGTMPMSPAMAATPPKQEIANLKERIQFSVKWWFVPLVDTYMETYGLPNQKATNFYRLTHQAAVNTFWNDRMESIINSRSLLPYVMETTIKDKEGQRSKNRIVFERDRGTARLFTVDPDSGEVVVEKVQISPKSMDPLSAFYYLRKRLSPTNPNLELRGITSSKRFSLKGKLAGTERIKVPAGTFDTYRIECTMAYWAQSDKESVVQDTGRVEMEQTLKKSHFTVWISQDDHRFPLKINYHFSLGNLTVKAVSLKSYNAAS